jgi:hypothetical protein
MQTKNISQRQGKNVIKILFEIGPAQRQTEIFQESERIIFFI